jgi:general secretion pathway protein D
MFRAPSRYRVAINAFSVLAILLLAGTLLAQVQRDGESELMDQARRLQKVAAQKVEAEVRRALQDAEALARANRARAVDCLKKALAQLEDDTALSPQRRESLKRMLRDRIRVTESDTDTPPASAAVNNKKPVRPGQAPEQNQSKVDVEKTRQSFRTIERLQADGKTEAASREASALARQRPNDTAALAAEQTTRAADQVANARRLQQNHERNLISGFRDIEGSSTLSNGDLEYPKDWKEKTKGRTATVALTAKEKSILQALNKTISVNFRNSKLEDVIEFLQTYTGHAILLDREAMKDAEISYDTGITLNVKGVTVRTLLRKILGDLGMTYVIKDETIQATSAQKAREMMVVRRYYVGDLLAGMGGLGSFDSPQAGLWNPALVPGAWRNLSGFPVAPAAHPQLQASKKTESVKQLIELVQGSVDPQSWQANGGTGTVTFHAPSMSLIIKQSAEVHAMLGTSGLVQ